MEKEEIEQLKKDLSAYIILYSIYLNSDLNTEATKTNIIINVRALEEIYECNINNIITDSKELEIIDIVRNNFRVIKSDNNDR